MLAVAILFFIICWITVSLRTYCRWRVIHSFGIDDQLLVLLLVCIPLFLSAGSTGESYHAIGYFYSVSRVTTGGMEAWHRKTRDRPIIRGQSYSFEGEWEYSIMLHSCLTANSISICSIGTSASFSTSCQHVY